MPPKKTSSLRMTPFRRYHPYRAATTLQITFPAEIAASGKHLLHTIFPVDSLASSLPPVVVLGDEMKDWDATTYFASLPPVVKTIAKPKGSVGRSAGSQRGYNLREKLGWSERVYKEVQKFIHDAASKLPAKRMTKQEKPALNATYHKVHKKWSYLGTAYTDNWAVRDFLQSYLNNIAEKNSDDKEDSESEDEDE